MWALDVFAQSSLDMAGALPAFLQLWTPRTF